MTEELTEAQMMQHYRRWHAAEAARIAAARAAAPAEDKPAKRKPGYRRSKGLFINKSAGWWFVASNLGVWLTRW